MGCGSSKLDTLPAVALCRDRCGLLDEALRLRFALAEAHLAYMHSLKEVGGSLHTFFDQQEKDMSVSPFLPLPEVKKKGVEKIDEPPLGSSSSDLALSGHHLLLDSDSGSGSCSCSHLDLRTDSDEGEAASSSESFNNHHLLQDGGFADLQLNARNVGQYGHTGVFQHEIPGDFSNRFMHTSYMKNQATPSVLYEQKQFSAETGFMDQSACNSYGVYDHWNPMPGSSRGGYLNYGGAYSSGYYGTAGSQYGGGGIADVGSRDDHKLPPPPPSPPRGSSWDFLNPFASFYDTSYSAYPSSRDLKAVREEEGIPDLEEDRDEVVNEVYDKKPADLAGEVTRGEEKSKVAVDVEIGKVGEVTILSPRRASLVEDDRLDNEVQTMEAEVVEREERITASTSESRVEDIEPRAVSDVVKDIQAQFEKAAETGNELAELLEVGRLPYHKKHGAYLAPSKMLHAMPPSLPVVFSHPSKLMIAQSSSLAVMDPTHLDVDEVTGMKTKRLSNTLQKLYLWEKKLCNEVKAEEKMRIIHDRKRRKLMHLDAKGEDADKVISTRNLVRSLGTKIKVAIQVVDRISSTLNRIRDEELLPQINLLIQGLTSMWRSMLECHRCQFQVIREAKNLDAIVSRKKFSEGEANLKATLDLEHVLINWALRFSSWVSIQKDFAKALNNWLFKCLLYEPEETPDGVAPFSPGRIGAPPIFIICNQWVQALEQISEKEVVDVMRELTMSVFSFWERDRSILRQNMVLNKELERQVRSLDKEDHKIHKEIQALDKRIVSVSRASSGLPLSDQYVYQTDTTNTTLHDSLQHVFDSMKRFSAESTKVYEELLQRSEEEILTASYSETL